MQVLSTDIETPLPGRELNARSRAFKFILVKNISAELGDTLHPDFRTRIINALVNAHARTPHAMDLRTTVPWFGNRRYIVMQAGIASVTPPNNDVGPLASRLFQALPEGTLDVLTERERAIIADCLERSEITQTHPLDWRPRMKLRIWRFYFNLIAGPDRRDKDNTHDVNRDRRAPSSEYLGVIIISIIAASLAATGVWLISDALLKAFFDPEVIRTLGEMLSL